MQPQKADSLTILLQKKQKIEQQIANARARQKKVDRSIDTRKKILIGAYFLEVKYKDSPAEIKKLMDGFLVRDNDRALFDLPPKAKTS